MRSRLIFFAALSISTGACTATTDLKPFEFQPEAKQPIVVAEKPACGFSELRLPSDFSVFAAGAYSGRKTSFQIDQSGYEGTQIDVAVNSPQKPVVLMLGAYVPTIWNIGWSEKTKILAVLVSGYHRQAVAGLEKNIPQLNSSHDNRGPCGYFYVSNDNLSALNPMAKRVFGRPVEMAFLAEKGKVVVGEPLQNDTKLVTSPETAPTSFYNKDAPIAGPAGLKDAVRKGLLRKATGADADAWANAVIQNSPQRDIPLAAGKGIPKPPGPTMHNAYVVLKSFTYPAGLYGGNLATFLIPKGIPRPDGNPGHSAVYDFNTLNCQGPLCRIAVGYSGVTTGVAQNNAGRHENGGSGPVPKSSVLCTGNLGYADESCNKNKELTLVAFGQNGEFLEYANASLKRDKNASPAILDDEELVEAAVMRDPSHGFQYASPRLKRDAEFILKMLHKNKSHCCDHTLRFVDASLKNDKVFMLKALAINNEFLKYGGDSIKKDREIGLYAINHEHGFDTSFSQLDISLKDDIDVAWVAIKQYGGSYKNVSDRLKKDRDLALAAVKWGAFMWKDVPQSLKDDLGFVHAAAALNPEVIEHMEERLRQDKAIVLIASRHSKTAERLIKGSFRRDKDVVLAAIESSDGALPLLLDESFQRDKGFIRSAVKKNGGALRYAPAKFIKDKEIVLAAVRNSGIALAFAGQVHQQDRDIVLAAVQQDWRALAYADKALRNDPEIVRTAVRQNAKSLIYAGQTVANQIGGELGIQIGSEQLVGEISPIGEHSRVDSSVLTSDGKRIYVLKNGSLSQYQIDPFRLIRSFKVGIDTAQPPERSDWFQMFITDDESKIVIHDTKSIKLLDLALRSISKSVPHESQNGLLVDNVFVTFGPDNLLTLWNAEKLLKIKTVAPDYNWTGTREVRHDEGSSFSNKYSLSRGKSSVFRLGGRIVIFIPAYVASHAGAPGEIFLINKDTFEWETRIVHSSEDPALAFDHKSIYVSGLKSVAPHKQNAKIETGGYWAMHRYDLESGEVIVVKPGNNPKSNAARLSFRSLNPHIPPAGQFHLVNGQVLASPDGTDATKRLYVYEDGEAVLFRYKQKSFELTDNARKYLRVKVSKDEIIPIDDATFEKFVVLGGGVRSRQKVGH